MKTLATIAAISAALTTAAVTLTQPPKKLTAQFQQAVSGRSVTVPQISGSDCLARYSGTHILGKSFVTLYNPTTGEGVVHWSENIEGCPSSLIHFTIMPNGESSLIFNSPARGPMASVPPAAVYAGTGNNVSLVSANEGSGWPGSLTVQ